MKWISVEEELPENGRRVLVRIDYGERQETEVYTWDRWWSMNSITHWMPLPPSPKRDN